MRTPLTRRTLLASFSVLPVASLLAACAQPPPTPEPAPTQPAKPAAPTTAPAAAPTSAPAPGTAAATAAQAGAPTSAAGSKGKIDWGHSPSPPELDLKPRAIA